MSPQPVERILVIGDRPESHEDLRLMLAPQSDENEILVRQTRHPERPRFEIDRAGPGREGLARVRDARRADRPYALALVDARTLANDDGLPIVEQLWTGDPRLAIVLCTGSSGCSWQRIDQRFGPTDRLLVLRDPLDQADVRQLVYSLVARARAERDAAAAKAALEQKSALLEAQLKVALDGILIVDRTGRKILQNERFVELLKIPGPIADDPDDTDQLRWVTGMARNPEQFLAKVRHLYAHPDETSRDEIEFKDGRVIDRYSSPVGSHGRIWTFRDITDRKRTEERLRWQATALEATANAILITAGDGSIQWANPAFTRLTGYAAQEVIGQNPRFLKSGQQSRAYYERLWQTITAGQVWRGELVNRRKDGSLYTEEMTITPARGADGVISRYIAIKQDISARKRAEEALRLSEERFRNLTENTSDWIWEIDEQGRYTYASPRLIEMLGYAPEEALGKTPFDFMPPEEAARIRTLLMPIVAAHATINAIENTNRHRDGHLVVVETSGVPVFDAGGGWRGYRGIDRDVTQQKRERETLRISEARFRELAENINDVFWVTDPQMARVHYVSPAYERLWGRTRRSIYDHPRSFLEGVHPDDRHVLHAAMDRLAAHGSGKCEYRVVRPDGSVRWVMDRSFPIRDDAGEVVRIAGIVQDITDRKDAEEGLRQQKERLTLALDAAGMGVWVWDFRTNRIYWSPECYEILGSTGFDGTPAAFTRLIHPEDRARIARAMDDPLHSQKRFTNEFRIVQPGGRVRWVANVGRGEFDGAGRALRVLGTVQDITDRRKKEESLRLLGSAVEQAKDSIIIVETTPDSAVPAIIYVNPAFSQMTGYTAEEVIGRTPEIFHGPRTDPALMGQLARRAEKSEAFALEIVNYRKDGTEFEVELRLAPIRDDAGKTTHFVVIQHDITERKRAEAELQQTQQELLEISRQAGMAEVAIGVLHNVGNVLNSVNVSATVVADRVRHTKAANVAKLAALFEQHRPDLAEFLARDPRGRMIPDYLGTLAQSLTTEQEGLLGELDELRKNIDHIKDIVAMQQAYARTSGVIETLPVIELVDDALRINAATLARHAVVLHRDYRARPVITTDKHKIMQILINLVLNAKYACDESGRTDKQITVGTRGDQRRVQIVVSDNGVGISTENLTRIFTHGFTTRKRGHGFGLHSGALAARELGGSLTAQSDGPGKGATFVLDLPGQPNPEAPPHEHTTG